jgi:hypothetical protein
MTTVTLLIFSGRPDPVWELTPGEVAEFVPQLPEFESAVGELSALGYRGFMVQSDDPRIPRKVIVHQSPKLESFLLRTGARHLSPEILLIVEEAIKRN